jgi:hypothetical protein
MLTAILIMFIGLAIIDSAEAAIINVASLPRSFSTNSTNNALNVSGGALITDVTFNTGGGSVWIGGAESKNWLETTSQPIGLYGMAFPLVSLGSNVGLYNIYSNTRFFTYDNASHDQFEAVITKGNNIWSGGTVIGGYTWGGLTRTGEESLDNGFPSPSPLRASVYVTPASDYYLNIFLQTTGDTTEPSWGRFSEVGVEGIKTPEPASLSLLGLGLAGLLRLRRKKTSSSV